MRAELGWALPLEVFPTWALGAPWDEAAVGALEHDADGRLAGFEQLGWAVRLDRYRAVAASSGERWLPKRVELSRGDLNVRLVIASWRI